MSLNLPPPPGFRGLDEHAPCEIYTRRLPHWRQQGATYFVTFHLADALPAARRRELVVLRQDWERRHPPPRRPEALERLARMTFQQVETWMDTGHGACWLSRPPYADYLDECLLHFHGERYELGCYVNMANHCHLVMRPFEGFDLEDLIGGIKKAVATRINQGEKLRGALWQQESYDRIVRDEEHLYRVIQYIGANPRRAGVARSLWRRWVNPTWEGLGWGFRDEE